MDAESLVQAVRASAHESWDDAHVERAIGSLRTTLQTARDFRATCDAFIALLERASLRVAFECLESRELLTRTIRDTAFRRIRTLVPDDPCIAGRCLLALARMPTDLKEMEGRWQAMASDDELRWLAGSDEASIVKAAFEVDRFKYIAGIVQPEHSVAVRKAAVDRIRATSDSNALSILLELGTQAAVNALIAELHTAGDAGGLVRALASIREAIAPLIELSSAPDRRVAIAATRALAVSHAEAARPRLEAIAQHGDAEIGAVAIDGLARMGRSQTTCALLRTLYDRSPDELRPLVINAVRCTIATEADVRWLADHGDHAAIDELVRRLDGPIPSELLDPVIDSLRRDPTRLTQWHFELHRDLIGRIEERLSELGVHDAGLLRLLELERRRQDRAMYCIDPDYAVRTSETPALDDSACFSVVTPEQVGPSDHFILELFVHTKDRTQQLLDWSSHKHAQRFVAGPHRIPFGSTVDVTVDLPGFTIVDPRARILWDGDLGIAQVCCRAPDRIRSETFPGTARFGVDGVTIATTSFVIAVGARIGMNRSVSSNKEVIRSAFASYATSDRSQVLGRIQGMQKVVPFIDIFLDVTSLRSGDNWAETIRDEIKVRDVLLLFWSTAASQSKYVDQEWRIALEEHGIAGISPVPLEGADKVPPPAELCSLHFHEWTLAIR